MSRAFINLLLIIIMCFTLSSLPLNKNLFDLDLSRFSFEATIQRETEIDGMSFHYIMIEKDDYLVNPDKLNFRIQVSTEEGDFYWEAIPELKLTLCQGDQIIREIPHQTFVSKESEITDIPLKHLDFTLDVSKETLDLDNGYYELKIFSEDERLKEAAPIQLKANYLKGLSYKAASDSLGDQLYMTLYFTDHNKNHIVPISRPVLSTKKVFRSTINGLLTPPHVEMGLSSDILVPYVGEIRYSNGMITCKIRRDLAEAFGHDPKLGQLAINTLTQTALDINTNFKINKVQFLVSNTTTDAYFGGVDLSQPFAVDRSPQVYLGLETSSKRILLVPQSLKTTNDTSKVTEIFDLLKNGHEDLLPILPYDVELLSANVEGITLKLNLSEHFKNIYGDQDELHQMTLDSMVNSFASIDGIENVEFQVDGKPLSKIGGISIANPVQPKNHINIE